LLKIRQLRKLIKSIDTQIIPINYLANSQKIRQIYLLLEEHKIINYLEDSLLKVLAMKSMIIVDMDFYLLRV